MRMHSTCGWNWSQADPPRPRQRRASGAWSRLTGSGEGSLCIDKKVNENKERGGRTNEKAMEARNEQKKKMYPRCTRCLIGSLRWWTIHARGGCCCSVAQSCPTLCDPMDCSTPGLPVHHQLLEFTQTHVHQVSDATQPSHPLLSPSPPAPNPSQHQGLFQWAGSLH